MYKRSKNNLQMHWDFIVLDMLCLAVSLLLAYWIGFGFTVEIDLMYGNIFFFLLLFDFFVIICTGAFQDVLTRGYWKEFLATFRQAVLIELVFVAYLIVMRSEQYWRLVIFLSGFYYLVLCYVVKIAWKAFVKKRRTLEHDSLLVITCYDCAQHVAQMICNGVYENYKVMGIIILDRDLAGEEIGGVKVLANQKTMLDYICRNWVDEVLFDVPNDAELPEGIVSGLSEMGVVVHLKIDEQSTDDGCKRFVERFGNYAVRQIADSSGESVNVSFYVKAEDPATTLEEARDYTFGILASLDRENTDAALSAVEEQQGFTLQIREYNGLTQLADALLDGEVGGIVLNEGYVDVYDEIPNYTDFADQIRALQGESLEQTQNENAPSSTVADDGVINIYISGSDTRATS
ncbi:MAG TPA: hypothetical protein IAD23_05800 [Candidatus Scubalenecus merdavium]|uniref:Uncharacterized protein n=1 Tax=Candidatus Scybalenecus merdavium TaxID=2840939 RepID=A0A9D1MUX4_9FIRM|nr:hypothetical protein [Candidatus Scubalenecus merdavium]